MIRDAEIVADIRRIVKQIHSNRISRSDYLHNGGRFTYYQIYEGGRTWEDLCTAAGIFTKRKEKVPDEIYFQRLQKAIKELNRLPKTSERKKFQLNFSKCRYPTLNAFTQAAAELGIIDRQYLNIESEIGSAQIQTEIKNAQSFGPIEHVPSARPVPPIPIKTRRKRWERIGLEEFQYAPQDELGVVAVFAILCSKGSISWDIIELRGGKGIDATCYDHSMRKELHVELKFIHSKNNWNHKIEEIDYVVCWENRWPDFPKPVIVLQELIKKL